MGAVQAGFTRVIPGRKAQKTAQIPAKTPVFYGSFIPGYRLRTGPRSLRTRRFLGGKTRDFARILRPFCAFRLPSPLDFARNALKRRDFAGVI